MGAHSYIWIGGDRREITDTFDGGYLPLVALDDGTEWYVAESSEYAGEKAREYWEDLANNDPEEFTCMVGEKTLVAWGLGQYAGPGYSQVASLTDWLDLWLDTPEEEWASYDGLEYDYIASRYAADEQAVPASGVAYRHN